jgi:hypothetical protein
MWNVALFVVIKLLLQLFTIASHPGLDLIRRIVAMLIGVIPLLQARSLSSRMFLQSMIAIFREDRGFAH